MLTNGARVFPGVTLPDGAHQVLMSADGASHRRSTRQRAEVLGLPEHLRDALWRVDSAGLAPGRSPGLVVAGMGGSAVGGRLARAVIGEREQRPIVLADGYELPLLGRRALDRAAARLLRRHRGDARAAGTPPARPARTASSPRTGGPLAERARAAGVPVIPIPGGFQPRAAVGYATVIALEVAAAAGAAPSLREEIEAAAAPSRAAALGPRRGRRGPRMRDGIAARVSAPTSPRRSPTAGRRQINENANRAAFASELPEHDHNEIEGWQAPLVPVFLVDPEQPRAQPAPLRDHARHRPRRRAGARRDRRRRRHARRAPVPLVLLGDLVSIQLAVARAPTRRDPGARRVKAAL